MQGYVFLNVRMLQVFSCGIENELKAGRDTCVEVLAVAVLPKTLNAKGTKQVLEKIK